MAYPPIGLTAMSNQPRPTKDSISSTRRYVTLPEDVYDKLLYMAGEFGYAGGGTISIVCFLDALSQVEPENLEPVLAEAEVLPYKA